MTRPPIHMLESGRPICGATDAKLISVCPSETTCPECKKYPVDRDEHGKDCGLCRLTPPGCGHEIKPAY